MPTRRTTVAIAITTTALVVLALAGATYSLTTYKRVPLVVGTLAVLTALAATYAGLSTTRFALIASVVGIPAVVVGPLAFPEVGALESPVSLAATYALVVAATAARWHWRDRPPNLTEAMAVAVVAVVALAPLSRWIVSGGMAGAGVGWEWLPFHLVRTVPVAFMLPLGVAETDRQQVGPTMAIVVAWVVPLTLSFAGVGGVNAPGVALASTALLLHMAAGGPLFLLGRRLAGEDSPLGSVTGWRTRTGAG